MPHVAPVLLALEQAATQPVRAREACVEIGHRLGRGRLAPGELHALRRGVASVRREPGGKLDGYLEALHDLLAACERAAEGELARTELLAWVAEVPGRGLVLGALRDRPLTLAALARATGLTRPRAAAALADLEGAGLVEPGLEATTGRRISAFGAELDRARREGPQAPELGGQPSGHARYEVAELPRASQEAPLGQAAAWRGAQSRGQRRT